MSKKTRLLGRLFRSKKSNRRQKDRGRLRMEKLEDRWVLAAPSINPSVLAGAQPSGALDGKFVYVNPGHGAFSKNNVWTTDRGFENGVQEDVGDQYQFTLFANYLFNAGATVVPLRPIGHQLNEIVLDNTAVGAATRNNPVLFPAGTPRAGQTRFNSDQGTVQYCLTSGECDTAAADNIWKDSTETVFFGDPASATEKPSRIADAVASETAFARYTPTIKQAGYYPLYAWTAHGANHATNQTYRVRHTGGTTEIKINHQRVGNGYVYLGTYYFESGSNPLTGSVEISNKAATGTVVIADAIRFGNGMGDIDRGGGVSKVSREAELSVYWLEAQRGQGNATVLPNDDVGDADNNANIGEPAAWAQRMNRTAVNGAATAAERNSSIFLAIHSNGGGGRGPSAPVAVTYNNVGAGNGDYREVLPPPGRRVWEFVGAGNGNFTRSLTGTPNNVELSNLMGRETWEGLTNLGSPPLENGMGQRANFAEDSIYTSEFSVAGGRRRRIRRWMRRCSKSCSATTSPTRNY